MISTMDFNNEAVMGKQRISYNSIRTSACDEEHEKRKERMNYGYHGQRESENVSKRTGKHPGRAFKPPWDFCTGRVEVGARIISS